MRTAVFHWCATGGSLHVAKYLAKALKSKLYSFLDCDDIIDISHLLPLHLRPFKHKRAFDYLCWSSIDIAELGNYDFIITSGHTTRAIVTPPDVIHVHYLHHPPKSLYFYNSKSLFAELFRVWDRSIDKNVDNYFCNSPITRYNLQKYYKRDGVVLYPPIETSKYKFKEYSDFYLHIGRIDKEKMVNVAVNACLKAKRKLILIGTKGNDKATYKHLIKLTKASPYVEYLGDVSESEKYKLLSECKAVLYPSVNEDFGLVVAESLASGKPIIVSNSGFPQYVVKQKSCGVVAEPNQISFVNAIHKLESIQWNHNKLISMSKEYDYKVFKVRLLYWLKKWYNENSLYSSAR
ncbi:hypothetical protein DRO97_06395 [Archaeoglobales archaeon]|nr:MAG: hypothetical protein DRO97_06395 [Archaeoglobales archaeon]